MFPPPGISVLNVNPDEAGRRSLTEELLTRGLMVHEATNDDAALALAKSRRPGVILISLKGARREDLMVCRTIKSAAPTCDIPVILLSPAFRDDRLSALGYEHGADICLPAPANPQVMEALIRSLARGRRTGRQLEESRLNVAAWLAACPGLAYVRTKQGKFLLVNEAWERATGYLCEDVVGRGAEELFPPETAHEFQQTDRMTLAAEEPVSRVEVVDLMNGRRILNVVQFPICGTGGAIEFLAGVSIDVTNPKPEREALRRPEHGQKLQAQKLETIGRMARGIAQILNGSVMSVLGNLSLALDSLPHGDPNRRYIESAMESATRIADLPRNLLAYGGSRRFFVEPVDLSALVRDTEELIRSSLPSQVDLCLVLQEGLPLTLADAGQIQDLLTNLVTNAIEAIGPERRGEIVVSTATRPIDSASIDSYLGYEGIQPGLYVCLEVRDSGPGVSEEIESKIFDPFFSTKDIGRGLGLARVLGILRSHKGAIRVTSIPGAGSTFTTYLPAAKPEDLDPPNGPAR